MKNVFSIDLEDWFCVSNMSKIIKREDWNKLESRVEKNTKKILYLLKKHNTQATFFVLGWVAERIPHLIKEISKQGHEIACHGYSHNLLTKMTPKSFEKDIRKAIFVITECTNKEILGYRAPSFSIVASTKWAFSVLEKVGIKYDSSVFPVSFHPLYGMPNSPLDIYSISKSLTEFPMSCIQLFGLKIAASGGAYFRLYPYWITRLFINYINKKGRPVVFYLHPWEIDYKQPRVNLPYFEKLRHYFNLELTYARLDRLLRDFTFTTMRDVLNINTEK